MICKFVSDYDSSISFTEWMEALENAHKAVDCKSIQLENGFLIIDNEAIEEIKKYIKGIKEIPPAKNAEDVLGDIEPCNIQEEITFEYFEDCTEDEINEGVICTNGLWNTHTWEKVSNNMEKWGNYTVTMFTGRKGYPSLIWES